MQNGGFGNGRRQVPPMKPLSTYFSAVSAIDDSDTDNDTDTSDS